MWGSLIFQIAFNLVWVVVAELNNTIEYGVNTECKTCPWSLCTNVAAYGYENGIENVTLVCWTRGTEIVGDRTWLQTTDDCYVSQYFLTNYAGEYEDDLPYCGLDSEAEFYTTQSASTHYDTECNIVPWIDSDTVHYHAPWTDLTLTCYTEGDTIIDDSTWLKTTSNCYVAQIGLVDPAILDELDNCGPIPFMELNYLDPDNAKRPSVGHRSELQAEPLQKRYLVNVTVGDDNVACRESPYLNSTALRRYSFDEEIRLQCLVVDLAGTNETFWSWTTDFCYVRSIDLWQSPEGDNYKFPLCSDFS